MLSDFISLQFITSLNNAILPSQLSLFIPEYHIALNKCVPVMLLDTVVSSKKHIN